MQYKKEGALIAVRLDKGEEVIGALTLLADKERIATASVTGIGATSDVTLGVYHAGQKRYYSRHYRGDYEICALNGNISRKDGLPYLHLHAVAANDNEGVCAGGHVGECVIGVTAEIFVTVSSLSAERFPDDETGINLLRFD